MERETPGAALVPTPVGAGRMCQNLFTGGGLYRFPDETRIRRPKENA